MSGIRQLRSLGAVLLTVVVFYIFLLVTSVMPDWLALSLGFVCVAGVLNSLSKILLMKRKQKEKSKREQ